MQGAATSPRDVMSMFNCLATSPELSGTNPVSVHLIHGLPGCGKTSVLRLLLQSLIQGAEPGRRVAALVQNQIDATLIEKATNVPVFLCDVSQEIQEVATNGILSMIQHDSSQSSNKHCTSSITPSESPCTLFVELDGKEDPTEVICQFESNLYFNVESIIGVLDAPLFHWQMSQHERQLSSYVVQPSTLLVLNKIEDVDALEKKMIYKEIAGLNAKSVVIEGQCCDHQEWLGLKGSPVSSSTAAFRDRLHHEVLCGTQNHTASGLHIVGLVLKPQPMFWSALKSVNLVCKTGFMCLNKLNEWLLGLMCTGHCDNIKGLVAVVGMEKCLLFHGARNGLDRQWITAPLISNCYLTVTHSGKLCPAVLTAEFKNCLAPNSLRFSAGHTVFVFTSRGYEEGVVTKHWDEGNAYRVLLTRGTEVWASEDEDLHIRADPFVGAFADALCIPHQPADWRVETLKSSIDLKCDWRGLVFNMSQCPIEWAYGVQLGAGVIMDLALESWGSIRIDAWQLLSMYKESGCMGCGKALANLITDVQLGDHLFGGLHVNHKGTIKIDVDCLESPHKLQSMIQAAAAVEFKQPKYKRCLAHSSKSHLQGENWNGEFATQIFTKLSKDAKTVFGRVSFDELDKMVKTYESQHKMCYVCKRTIKMALKCLTGAKDPRSQPGYNMALFTGFQANHCEANDGVPGFVQISVDGDLIPILVRQAVLGIPNTNCVTCLADGQKHVLHCLGMILNERLFELMLHIKAEESVCNLFQTLAWQAVIKEAVRLKGSGACCGAEKRINCKAARKKRQREKKKRRQGEDEEPFVCKWAEDAEKLFMEKLGWTDEAHDETQVNGCCELTSEEKASCACRTPAQRAEHRHRLTDRFNAFVKLGGEARARHDAQACQESDSDSVSTQSD